jgi:hypothetical protein
MSVIDEGDPDADNYVAGWKTWSYSTSGGPARRAGRLWRAAPI